MRILLLEPDPQYRNAVRGALEARGYEVTLVANVDQVFAQHRVRAADLLIVAIEPGSGGSPAELTRRAEGEAHRPPAGLLLISSHHHANDPDVKALFAQFAAAEWLGRPFGALDLVERVEAIAKRVKSAGASRAGASRGDAGAPDLRANPGDPRVLSLLARLWANRASGVLSIEQGGVERLARLSQGGIVDPDSKALIFAALRGGAEVRFEPGDVGDRGDPAALGELLWRVARDPRQTGFAAQHRFEALSRTPQTNAALTLPIGDGARRLLSSADGAATLGQLIAAGAMDSESVSIDLYALRQLRLVGLQTPVQRVKRVVDNRVDVSAPPAAPAAPGGNETIAINVWHDPSSHSGGARSDRSGGARDEAPRNGVVPGGGASATVQPIGGIKTRPQDPRSSEAATEAQSSHSVRRRAQIAESLRSSLVQNQTNAPTATGTNASQIRSRAGIGPVISRLEREIVLVRSSAPAVVLGIPPDSPPDVVRQAAERQRQRYLAMEDDPLLPPDGKQLAREIRQRVDEAERDWGKGVIASPLAAGAVDADRLLELGRAQVARQDWQAAEQTLSRARAQRADHPGVLAYLGWARFNNVRYGLPERTKEARELLLLAEQFDANHGEAQYYLAELLYRLGEYAAALPRANRAMRAQPENTDVATLHRKLRSRVGA